MVLRASRGILVYGPQLKLPRLVQFKPNTAREARPMPEAHSTAATVPLEEVVRLALEEARSQGASQSEADVR